MGAGFTEIDIANMTISMVKAATIVSFGDANENARWFKRNYPIYRQVMLETERWSFAGDRAELASDPDNVPAFEWKTAYRLPQNFASQRQLTTDGKRDSPSIAFEREGQHILTNTSADTPLYFRYTRTDVIDEDFTALFVQAFAVYMAAPFSYFKSQKSGVSDRFLQQRAQAISEAKMADAKNIQVAAWEDTATQNARLNFRG